MQENNIFVVFKKSMRKIWSFENVFLHEFLKYNKNISFLHSGFYIYIYHIVSKTGYFKCEIDIFLQHKKNSDLKINIPENHKSLFLSFIFFWKKKKQ
jgi:hypothetical protein